MLPTIYFADQSFHIRIVIMAYVATDFPPGYAEEDISSRVVIAASLFIVLEIGIVAIRLVSRLKFGVKLGVEDYLVIPALCFCLGMCAIGIGK